MPNRINGIRKCQIFGGVFARFPTMFEVRFGAENMPLWILCDHTSTHECFLMKHKLIAV